MTCAVIFVLFFSDIARAKLLTPYSLAIYDVGRRDRGMYQCMIVGKESSAQAVAELRLGGKFNDHYDDGNHNILNANSSPIQISHE